MFDLPLVVAITTMLIGLPLASLAIRLTLEINKFSIVQWYLNKLISRTV